MIEERDIIVAMRDGTRLAVDVYRPDAPGRYPVLYASALHNKDIQGPDIAEVLPPQPLSGPNGFCGQSSLTSCEFDTPPSKTVWCGP